MNKKKNLIIGFGNQGKKRLKFLNKNNTIIFDPFNKNCLIKNFDNIDLNEINYAFLCTPDEYKISYLKKLLFNNINTLVEKPLLFKSKKEYNHILSLLNKHNPILYTSYNHVFEKSLIDAKKDINKNKLGKIHRIKIVYANGTQSNVKNSWRDLNNGIIKDIGCHLFNILIFLFENTNIKISSNHNYRYSNNAYDHSLIVGKISKIDFQLELSYHYWKNTFEIYIMGEKANLKISSLSKWAKPYIKEIIIKKFPSGIPKINKTTYKNFDNTWSDELKSFIAGKVNSKKSLKQDYIISNLISILK